MSSRRSRRIQPEEKKKFPGWGWALIIIGIIVVITIIIIVVILLLRGDGDGVGGGCTSDTDCSGITPKCNITTGICQGCLILSDCPSGQVCTGGQCITPPGDDCDDDNDCSSPTPACDGTDCVECTASNTTECAMGETCNTTTNLCEECPIPATVTDLVIISAGPGLITGTYTSEVDVTYTVEVRTAAMGGGTIIPIVGSDTSTGGTLSVTIATGGTVFVRIRGENDCENVAIDWSNDSSACIQHTAPTGFGITIGGGAGSYTFVITMANSGGSSSFAVDFWTGPGGTGANVVSLIIAGPPLIFPLLIPPGTYFIRIQGGVPCTPSPFSADINVVLT